VGTENWVWRVWDLLAHMLVGQTADGCLYLACQQIRNLGSDVLHHDGLLGQGQALSCCSQMIEFPLFTCSVFCSSCLVGGRCPVLIFKGLPEEQRNSVETVVATVKPAASIFS